MKNSYVRHLLLEEIQDGNFNSSFQNRFISEDELTAIRQNLAWKSFSPYGLRVEDQYHSISNEIINYLIQHNAIRVSGDDYAGHWYQLIPKRKDELVKDLLASNPASASLKSLPDTALSNALIKIATEDSLVWDEVDSNAPINDIETDKKIENNNIPASDRIVKINHNQIANLDKLSGEIIHEIESLNKIEEIEKDKEESRDIRQYILGGLKAGRELIRAGEFKLYAINITIIEALKALVKRYEDEIIGALAAKLIEEILKIVPQL